MFKTCFVALLFVLSSLHAHIVETHQISEIVSEIDKETLVLFDLDETTLTTTTTLGTSAWWTYFTDKFSANRSLSKKETHRLTPLVMSIVHRIMQATNPKTVEPETTQLIHSLQEQGITVIALTGRCMKAPWNPYFAEFTRDQLKELGINFEKSLWPEQIVFDPAHPPTNYAYGVVFSNFQPKGPVLVQFLQELNFRPKKIVMVDDLNEFLNSVDQSMAEENIPFVGFRYGHLDPHILKFDPMIGNIQLQKLLKENQLLSDEEAAEIKQELLKQNPIHNPDFYLEELLNELRDQIRNS